jgi:hypothetical protein
MRRGRDIPTTEHPVALNIYTRCPSKWVLVDTETGQTYRGNPNGYWDRLIEYTRDNKLEGSSWAEE